ncbi:MAG: branched-chain amino acid ABC transporter permease [Alkalispirochaeta sp.]|jgi:branched-chain amino acid transport system permease protein
MKKKHRIYTVVAVVIGIGVLALLETYLGAFPKRIFVLAGIYVTLALSLNLINGFTGLFTLGHAGFMAVGAYTCALLTMPPELKAMNFFLKPIVPFLANVEWPFLPALLMAGLVAGFIGFLIAAPVLRLRDDYLAIATLGFGEIIRIVFTNTQTLTNGALGLKGLPRFTTVWWSWGVAALTVLFMVNLINSSYGKAFKAIREDEVAAEAMGISLFRHKVVSFTIGSVLAGIGGALMGHLLGAIDPLMFRFLMTFNILLIVVLGGIGSITGSVVGAVLVTITMEFLRVLDGTIDLGFITIAGKPGMRMVIFSAGLMAVVIFYQKGLMGHNEFTWAGLSRVTRKLRAKLK